MHGVCTVLQLLRQHLLGAAQVDMDTQCRSL